MSKFGLDEFRNVFASLISFEEPCFYNTGCWKFSGCTERKVSLLLSISPNRVKKALRNLSNQNLNTILYSFVLLQWHKKTKNENKGPIVEYHCLSRASQIQAFTSLFYGEPIYLDQRVLEREFVRESSDEVKNIFITFSMKNGKEFHFPRHLFIRILSYAGYNRRLLTVVGKVSKDFYLTILSTWPRITISQRYLFGISILVLKNVREINFTKKSVSLKKEELEYVWKHISPSNIRVLNFGKCHGASSKILYSITNVSSENFLIFDQCRTLILPTEKPSLHGLRMKQPFSHHFPNISRLHLSSSHFSDIIAFGENNNEKKFPRLRELHFTVLLDLFSTNFAPTKNHLTPQNIPLEMGRILVCENVNTLVLSFTQFGASRYISRIDHQLLSSFLGRMLEKFSELEHFTLKFLNRHIGNFSTQEIVGLCEHLPRTLKQISIGFKTQVRHIQLPKDILNACCERITIHPLHRKCVDEFCRSIFSWKPIPRHYDIGIPTDLSFSDGFDDLISLCTEFVRNIQNLTSFRLFTWSHRLRNVCDPWTRKKSRGDRLEISFDEKRLDFKGSTFVTRHTSDYIQNLKVEIASCEGKIDDVTIESGCEFGGGMERLKGLMFKVLLNEKDFSVVEEPSESLCIFGRKKKKK